MTHTSAPEIVVLGGYGTFGRLIASELAGNADVVVAGRSRAAGQSFADSIGAGFSLCNVRDEASLRDTIAGAKIVINATGPFLPGEYSIPKICLDEACHYIDLADNRTYVSDFMKLSELARARAVFACTGASTAPAVTSALLFELSRSFPNIHAIDIYLSAGNKNQAGLATFESILSYAGTLVPVWSDNRWKVQRGWGLSEVFEFPTPVGKRLVQLCNVPDLELFPKLFAAEQVIFKAGVELPVFNLGLSLLARLKQHFPRLDLPSLAGPLVGISRRLNGFGSFAGAVLVKVTDRGGNSRSLGFVTSQNGPRLPAAPAALLARRLLKGDLEPRGAFPCIRFIELSEFQEHLERFGLRLFSQ